MENFTSLCAILSASLLAGSAIGYLANRMMNSHWYPVAFLAMTMRLLEFIPATYIGTVSARNLFQKSIAAQAFVFILMGIFTLARFRESNLKLEIYFDGYRQGAGLHRFDVKREFAIAKSLIWLVPLIQIVSYFSPRDFLGADSIPTLFRLWSPPIFTWALAALLFVSLVGAARSSERIRRILKQDFDID